MPPAGPGTRREAVAATIRHGGERAAGRLPIAGASSPLRRRTACGALRHYRRLSQRVATALRGCRRPSRRSGSDGAQCGLWCSGGEGCSKDFCCDPVMTAPAATPWPWRRVAFAGRCRSRLESHRRARSDRVRPVAAGSTWRPGMSCMHDAGGPAAGPCRRGAVDSEAAWLRDSERLRGAASAAPRSCGPPRRRVGRRGTTLGLGGGDVCC